MKGDDDGGGGQISTSGPPPERIHKGGMRGSIQTEREKPWWMERSEAVDRAIQAQEPPVPPIQVQAPKPKVVYTSPGDPFRYTQNPDGSITVSGAGKDIHTVRDGSPAYSSILAQIKSGQLKSDTEGQAPLPEPSGAGPRSIADMNRDDREVLGWGLGEAEGMYADRQKNPPTK